EVERFITEPIEQQLYSIPGARRISSRSREGQSLVQLQFAWGTDMEFATLHTREKLDNLTERLPEGSERPTILRSDPTSDPIMTLAVSGTDLRSLRDLSEVVFKRRLEQLDGVSLAGLTGGPERELRVIVDPEYLDVHEVSLSEISNALDQANYNAPGGTIQRGRFEYSLRTLGQFREVEELLDVVIARPRGVGSRPVRLTDVATVVDTIADLETIARFNGEPAIGLQVFKEAGTNTVRVADGVRETLDQLREEFQGISIEIASSQAAFIRDAISNVVSALLLGGALAFLVLFLFLRDPRYPLAIGLAIPISVMAAFALCYAFDVSLNIMSLGGLALGVGLLVDNSIVVLENIFRHREESGGSARESAGRGAREVAAAITASTLTTIAVFGPVLYVEGVAGALFGDLSLAVTFSLLASLLVALTLLPVLAAQVARGRRGAETAGFDGETFPSAPDAPEAERPGRVRRVGRAVRAGAVAGVRGVGGGVAYVGRSVKLTGVDVATGGGRVLGLLFGPFLRAFERAFLRFAGRYERTLEWALAHRLEVLSIAIVALAGAIMLAGSLPRGLMPRVDEQQFWVELNLPQGTPIRTTDETAGEVERLLLDMADVSGIFTRVGRSRGSELAARDLTGLNNAALDVQLAGSSRPTSEAIAELRARLPESGVDPAFVTIETGRATSLGRALAIGEADLAVKVQSGELEELVPVAEAIETRLEGVPVLADVRLDFLRTQPELVIEINREVAARHQITVTSVATAIEDYLRGSETRNAYSVFADKVDIRVTIPETARRELDRVLGLRLQGVPIGELVTVRQGFGPVEIRREDQNRTIQVLADVAEGGLRTAVRQVEAAIADIPRPALTTVRVGGENEEMQDSFRSLTFAFGLALALVFLIMAAQFESLVQPLVVLTAVPLAAIGAVTALWIAGGGLNAMSGIGFVILIGIVVNDAIVKVDFINQRRRAGLAKRAAILEAGRLRLRPIVMTTITTVVGLLPLAAGLGAGADLRAPLAVVVIGGLISATFLTLIVVPVVYSVLVEPSVSVGPDPGPRPERRDPSGLRPTPGYGLGGRSGPAAPGMARGSAEP
ncbi:efflux RND transporter permease subunit, partial [Candidatus Palauibacter polyketidifaciens]|uniref:efflux RND transporter permease subunit n=1 Tax=Candidatus Palauibacter polyketidifaciens TaxID=3056740 RepID=UPI0023A00351